MCCNSWGHNESDTTEQLNLELGLKINDVEHLFMGLLAISMSSWKYNLLRSSGLFFFFLVELDFFSFFPNVELHEFFV